MLLADIGDTPYQVMLYLHILAMFAAFAPMFVHPFLERDTAADTSLRAAVFTGIARRSMRIYGAALIVGGLLGFGVAGMSKAPNGELVYSVSDSWLWPSVVLWLAMNGVLHAMIIPDEKKMAAGDDTAGGRVAIGGPLITVLFLVTLYLMVFKPGA